MEMPLTFCHHMWRLLLIAMLAVCPALPNAQEDDIQASFKKLDPQEEQRLRSLLAEPLPANLSPKLLDLRVREMEVAAALVGDNALLESLLRQAVPIMPLAADLKKKLADVLFARGSLEEGINLMRDVIASGDPVNASAAAAEMICTYYRMDQDDAARAASSEAEQLVKKAWATAKSNWERNLLTRVQGMIAFCQSMLEDRLGHYTWAIRLAEESEQHARKALLLYSSGISMPQLLNSKPLIYAH